MIGFSLLAAWMVESTFCDLSDGRFPAGIAMLSISVCLLCLHLVQPLRQFCQAVKTNTINKYTDRKRRVLHHELASLRSSRKSTHLEHVSSYCCTICSSETQRSFSSSLNSVSSKTTTGSIPAVGKKCGTSSSSEGAAATDALSDKEGPIAVDENEFGVLREANGTIRADALNRPCGHMFLCYPCATSYRNEFGEVCNSCGEPSIIFQVQFHSPSIRRARERSRGPSVIKKFENLATKREGDLSKLSDIRLEIRKEKVKIQLSMERHESMLCTKCKQRRADAIHEPCGHCVFCWECAKEHYGNKGGEAASDDAEARLAWIDKSVLEGPCIMCRIPSLISRVESKHTCRVCYDEVDMQYLFCMGKCGHLLCTGCTHSYVRSALGNVATDIHANGMRCPLRPFGCEGMLAVENLETLVDRPVHYDVENDTTPINSEEFERLERFIYEAGIPGNERFYCCNEKCARMIRVDKAFTNKTAIAKMGDKPRVKCPFCQQVSCARCKIPMHGALTCAEVAQMNDDSKSGLRRQLSGRTEALIAATSKPCPNCGYRITHYHGHACHHIAPGTGCLNCGTHFCYQCLKPHSEGRCSCPTYCSNDNIRANIVDLPVAHDKRCGCVICPDCRLSKPCALCDGGCVVCRGSVPPGANFTTDQMVST